ncbi:MAG: hypothetical protein M3Y27_31870, partial [Acidobacteriota bacterium]|nr:hypothetical protein [Acidobacteriota bacterium]
KWAAACAIGLIILLIVPFFVVWIFVENAVVTSLVVLVPDAGIILYGLGIDRLHNFYSEIQSRIAGNLEPCLPTGRSP